MVRTRRLLFLALLASAAFAQTPSVRSPQSGLVYDPPSRSLRTIAGFLGAAYLGAACVADIDAASVAPGGRFALIAREETIRLVRGLDRAEPEEILLAGLPAPWRHVLWNGAEVWIVTSTGLSRVHALDFSPVADPPVELPSPPAALALHGGKLLLALADGIYQLTEPGALSLVFSLEQPCALAASPQRIFAASCAVRRFVAAADSHGAPEDLPVPETAETPALAGAALSADGGTLFVADASASRILVFDFAAGVWLESLPVDAPPAQMEALPGAAYVLRTPVRRGEPVLILDTAAAPPAVWFVPAGDLP